jgi:ribose transport system substrate-binding protein
LRVGSFLESVSQLCISLLNRRKLLRPEAKLGTVKIVCFDDERETLAAIKEGAIFGTVAQQPFDYGYQAVKTAAQILKGDRSAIPGNKMIFVPTVVIQRHNVDDYSKKLDQLLGK